MQYSCRHPYAATMETPIHQVESKLCSANPSVQNCTTVLTLKSWRKAKWGKKKKVFSLTCIQTQKFSSSTYWYFPNHQNHIIYYSGFISPLPRVSLPTHAHGPLLTMTELPSLTFDLRTNSSCSHFIETTKGKWPLSIGFQTLVAWK